VRSSHTRVEALGKRHERQCIQIQIQLIIGQCFTLKTVSATLENSSRGAGKGSPVMEMGAEGDRRGGHR
jgi:hypothetical protein